MAAASDASAQNVTGTYIARFSNAAKLIQVVQTASGELTGQYEEAVLSGADGTLSEQTFPVTGAANGNTITISIKTGILSSPTTAFGTVDGDRLTVNAGFSGGKPQSETYVRADAHEFEADVAALNTESRKIQTAIATVKAKQQADQAEREFMADLVKMLTEIDAFNAGQDKRISLISAAQQHFRTITAKMNQYLDQERQLVAVRQAEVKRAQISVSISQGAVATEQANNEASAATDNLRDRMKTLWGRVDKAGWRCRLIAPAMPQNIAIVETPIGVQACNHLFEVEKPFVENVKSASNALDELKATYREELAKQNNIVAESNRIE
jgi:hypothetical protein